MNPYRALQLQMQLEGLTLRADGLLTALPTAVEDCPLVLLAQLVTGETVLYLHPTLPQTTRIELAQWRTTAAFTERNAILETFIQQGLAVQQGHSKTYTVPGAALPVRMPVVKAYAKDDARIVAFGFNTFADQVYALCVDDHVVSACVSVRENDQCAEAWVATAPAYQQRGYAQRVVAAWARHIIAQGKVPFYSHRIDNRASAALAQRLGCRPLFEAFIIAPHAEH